jgi:hypothetical protein
VTGHEYRLRAPSAAAGGHLGDETFAGLQRFLSTVHRLTSERRLSRFAYLGRKPGE